MGLKFNPFTGKLDFTGSAGGGGSGTVTSVTGGTGLTGGTITTSGTLAVSYGTTAGTAAEGNDARLSDARIPTGAAGGDLAGTYPNPTVDGLQGRPVSNATPVNGQVLQYDGANWVPGSIPSGGSGGGGVVYYLNFNTAADTPLTNIPQTPNASKELGIVGDVTGTSYLSPILSTASYDFLASFVTDVSTPSATAIPAGIWDFNLFIESTTTNSANQIYFKIEIRKYDGTNAPVLLATSNDTYIYDPAEINQYVASVVMPQTTILSTDRIVVYLYGRAHQNNNRLTFHFGGSYPSHTHSTMPSVTGTGVVKVVNGVFQSPATTIVNADVSASAAIDQSKIANLTTDLAAKVGGSVGAVDNAVLRADVGTGIVQNSGLIIDDAIVSFAVTGVASTDIITATGSSFANGQPVRFTALTGGSGLNTTTNYYVINVSGATFQVSTSVGGGASLFTTDITVGTLVNGHSVSTNVTLSENTTATNSDLVLTPKGTGAFILGPKPDGTATGGNARGANAVDFQTTTRGNANQVASGTSSFIGGGSTNRASATRSIVLGGTGNSSIYDDCAVLSGNGNSCSGGGPGLNIICGGSGNSVASNTNANTNFIGAGSSNGINFGSECGIVCGNSNAMNSGSSRSFIGSGVSNSISTTSSAIASGTNNSTSGQYSFIGGGGIPNAGNQITANNSSILGGASALGDRFGMQSHASGRFAATGDAQRARFVLRCKTTTNTAVEMALDGSTTYLGIPSGKVIACTINISGVKSDGSAVAHYVRQYAVKNVGGTSSEVYAPVTIGTDNAAGTVIALSANNGDDTLRIAVTGIASETWRWVASVDAVEIAYGT